MYLLWLTSKFQQLVKNATKRSVYTCQTKGHTGAIIEWARLGFVKVCTTDSLYSFYVTCWSSLQSYMPLCVLCGYSITFSTSSNCMTGLTKLKGYLRRLFVVCPSGLFCPWSVSWFLVHFGLTSWLQGFENLVMEAVTHFVMPVS